MAKPKGWVKRNRVFLNTPVDGCMAGVSWSVQLYYHHNRKTGIYEAHTECNCQMNDEAKSHYVHRRADLRALRNMRKELDAFEEACIQALNEAEEFDAKSKN